ncbi:16S rRNA (cytosine(1402)-N(4))-methyltransferase [Candidatus Uhrbacteria bacterium CG_4_9_14_3_um_filter_36_7]|uniref:Ribosomal RNA small subunit methyltransferase H n=1 Tax=Candidatus Uhrbacteria bacterium CG_4_9_14_3_um_filter_36_7 TaxID=1975033 RepID=A0A2M7XGF1_9BACT|nr:MAG: 16S rRNA (cytosine(1402)-N(4))-methyltransferase [Candidatus Uhrbacteria bacterium CG_4_9_14_3_um_filter_36_7]
MTSTYHIPVLLDEIISYLDPQPGQTFIDGTVGQGGHAQVILEHVIPGGRLLGIDKDPSNLEIAKERLASYSQSVVFVCDSYRNLKSIAKKYGISSVSGIILDLGFCSSQVDEAARGFSFQEEGPLDMRYNLEQDLTAQIIVNEWSEQELTEIFIRFGEEINAKQIARAIIQRRKQQPLETTIELAHLMTDLFPKKGRLHPATKIFQALRIAVNHELNDLIEVLPQAVELLASHGRLAVISFHSLEDRILKDFFKQKEKEQVIRKVTKSVVQANQKEKQKNHRARSAKLRVIEKL